MIADLTGKNALVTGGGQGIGRGIALKLAEQGADVAIADINDTGAATVVDEIKALDRKSFSVRIDVTDNASVSSAISSVIAEFGHLDILINNGRYRTCPRKGRRRSRRGLGGELEHGDGHQRPRRDALH